MRPKEKTGKPLSKKPGVSSVDDFEAIRKAKAKLGLNGDAGIAGQLRSDLDLLKIVADGVLNRFGYTLWNVSAIPPADRKEIQRRLESIGWVPNDEETDEEVDLEEDDDA